MALVVDISREIPAEEGMVTAEWAISGMGRGVAALGLGGPEIGNPPEKFKAAFERAYAAGLPAVPHEAHPAGITPQLPAKLLRVAQQGDAALERLPGTALRSYRADTRLVPSTVAMHHYAVSKHQASLGVRLGRRRGPIGPGELVILAVLLEPPLSDRLNHVLQQLLAQPNLVRLAEMIHRLLVRPLNRLLHR